MTLEVELNLELHVFNQQLVSIISEGRAGALCCVSRFPVGGVVPGGSLGLAGRARLAEAGKAVLASL